MRGVREGAGRKLTPAPERLSPVGTASPRDPRLSSVLEAAAGVEPANNDFADRRLNHLAMPPPDWRRARNATALVPRSTSRLERAAD